MNPIAKRRCFVGATLGLTFGAGLLASEFKENPAQAGQLQWRERALHGFGTTLHLRAAHANLGVLKAALDEAVAMIRHIESQMSLFDASSALARLNRDGYIAAPDAHLLAVFEIAMQVSRQSAGLFDVTVQPLWRLWADETKHQRLPTAQAVALSRNLADWRSVRVSSDEIRFLKTGMQATLNGIAQGYAADAAKAVLIKHGVEHALLNTGEWSVLGRSENQTPWQLGVADPMKIERLLSNIVSTGDSVATSNDLQNAVGTDRRYHHILDPRSGESPPDIALACVVAPSCALADALTKVLFMTEFDNTIALAHQWNVKAIVVNKAGVVKSS